MKQYKILLLSSIIMLCSCEDFKQKISDQQEEITALQDSLTLLKDTVNVLRSSRSSLTEELNRYRMSPEKLAVNADQLYKDGNIQELERIFNLLKKYHPESNKAIKVSSLITKFKAEQEAKALTEREERLGALKKLRKEFDNVQNITWYYNKRFTHYTNSNHTSIYMGQHGTDGGVWLRLKMSYEGDDWIFFENAYLSYDGRTMEIPFEKYKERKSDNEGGRVWEWIDVSVTPDILSFLSELVEGKEVKMRLSGKYSKTRILPSSEVSAIKEVLLGYELLQDPNNR